MGENLVEFPNKLCHIKRKKNVRHDQKKTNKKTRIEEGVDGQ